MKSHSGLLSKKTPRKKQAAPPKLSTFPALKAFFEAIRTNPKAMMQVANALAWETNREDMRHVPSQEVCYSIVEKIGDEYGYFPVHHFFAKWEMAERGGFRKNLERVRELLYGFKRIPRSDDSRLGFVDNLFRYTCNPDKTLDGRQECKLCHTIFACSSDNAFTQRSHFDYCEVLQGKQVNA